MMEKFYKLVYDITCFYVFTAFFFYFAFQVETDMLAYGVLLLTVLLHVCFEQTAVGTRIKIAVLALPLVCFLKEGGICEKIQFIIPWIYMIIVVLKTQYGLYYEEFKGRFKGMIAALLIPLIFFGCSNDLEVGKTAIMQMVPFLFVFFASGVLLMQNLRFCEDGKARKEFEKHQLRQMVLFFLFCILVTTGRIIQLLSEYILLPFFKAILLGAMGLLYMLYEKAMPPAEHRENVKKALEKMYGPEPTMTPQPMPEVAPGVVEILKPEQVSPEITPEFIMVCAAVAMVILLFFVLRGSSKSKAGEARIEDEREALEEVEVPEKKLKNHSVHPDVVIRYYYLKFMEMANSKEIKVLRSDTTQEIREKFLLKDAEKVQETDELTKIYQKVRYTEIPVTKEDSARMKALMKKLSN